MSVAGALLMPDAFMAVTQCCHRCLIYITEASHVFEEVDFWSK